jgi:L-histidine Nalpha-methyltransferase / hercynylcysteine S-oxide synthase
MQVDMANVRATQNHSEVPEADDDWPSLSSILAFRDRVRTRLRSIYDEVSNGKRKLPKRLARTLVMCLEHEGWHVEVTFSLL